MIKLKIYSSQNWAVIVFARNLMLLLSITQLQTIVTHLQSNGPAIVSKLLAHELQRREVLTARPLVFFSVKSVIFVMTKPPG